jgi:three-Cys-motif partner protein
MPGIEGLRLDEIGIWSEVKLDIVKKYAATYSTILAAQKPPGFHHSYIDAFAGAGVHISKTSRQFIPGSPTNALLVKPPFKHYYFIDLDDPKCALLREIAGARSDVQVEGGDCNAVLVQRVLPNIRYEDRRRALCVLDPYGLHVKWTTIMAIARTKAVEIFYNFSIYDANLNVLRTDPRAAVSEQVGRMTECWGDESWKEVAYSPDLFGTPRKEPPIAIAKAFQRRLSTVAGFAHVPDPLPVRLPTGATLYYLFFASHKPVAGKIVAQIFNKHGRRGPRVNGGTV